MIPNKLKFVLTAALLVNTNAVVQDTEYCPFTNTGPSSQVPDEVTVSFALLHTQPKVVSVKASSKDTLKKILGDRFNIGEHIKHTLSDESGNSLALDDMQLSDISQGQSEVKLQLKLEFTSSYLKILKDQMLQSLNDICSQLELNQTDDSEEAKSIIVSNLKRVIDKSKQMELLSFNPDPTITSLQLQYSDEYSDEYITMEIRNLTKDSQLRPTTSTDLTITWNNGTLTVTRESVGYNSYRSTDRLADLDEELAKEEIEEVSIDADIPVTSLPPILHLDIKPSHDQTRV